ncbi:MAG: ribosome-associated translation inhibitor RaiA [Lactobacillales bacterium]|jgi:ribosomal subunit interface protein|nr:ribosome-associated translation inhibitor RaiA [Lactobacillales bacterium]
MFTYNVHGENIEVTEAIRDYAVKRVEKLEKYFNDVEATVHVNIRTYKEKTAKVEVTIPMPRLTLRAEDTEPDLYQAIDFVVEKLERQIHKYKTKIHRRARSGRFVAEHPVFEETPVADHANDFDIIRNKTVEPKPMSAEEAVLQMNLLGHPFYVFKDAEDDNVNIVYARKDGRYGLIETE